MKPAMAPPSSAAAVDAAQRLRAANRRVAWTLSSIAAVFFAGIIATRWVGGGAIGIGVIGTAVLLFLVVAIGRNLRRSDEGSGASEGPKRGSTPETARAGRRRPDRPPTANEAGR